MDIIKGGSATLSGIALASERYEVKASIGKGSNEPTVRWKARKEKRLNRIAKAAGAIPIFGKTLEWILSSPLLASVLILSQLGSQLLGLVESDSLGSIASGLLLMMFAAEIIFFAVFAWNIRKILGNHSVEHRVINCILLDQTLVLENVRRMSHFNVRCGSLLVIFSLPVWILLQTLVFELPGQPIACFVISMSTALWIRGVVLKRKVKWVTRLASAIQRLVCWKPNDRQILVGIAAANKLIELETSEHP